MSCFRAFSVALVLACTGGPALAQMGAGAPFPAPQPFVSIDLSGGWTFDPTTSAGFSADMGMDFAGSIGLGMRMGPVLVELQHESHTFFLNNLNPIPPATLPAPDYDGDVDVYAMTAQVLVELGDNGPIRPYVGASGGIALLSADYYEDTCLICAPGARYVTEDDYAAVWSVTAGLNLGAPGGVEYYAGYRHFRTDDFDLSTVGGARFTHKGLRSDNIELGIRVGF